MNDDLILLRDMPGAIPRRRSPRSSHATSISFIPWRCGRLRDPHLAEEITRAVFIISGAKADSLGGKTILPAGCAARRVTPVPMR